MAIYSRDSAATTSTTATASATATTTTEATTTEVKGCPRRLFELLEEKQEPFVLEIYLFERGYCSTRKGGNNSPTKFLNNNSSTNNSIRKTTSLQFSSIAKSIYSKIGLVNGVLKPKNGSKKKKRERWKNNKEVGSEQQQQQEEEGRCSTPSFSTTSKTFSESDTDKDSISFPANDETILHNKKGGDRVMRQWRLAEENKQFSPNSVLDEIDLLHSIPVYNVKQIQQEPPTASRMRHQKKASEDSILSASLWEMLEQAKTENTEKLRSKSFPKYMNSMKAMLQTRQLLFDCVRDAVETRNNDSKKRGTIMREKGLMGPEEIGKIVCNNMRRWGKLLGNERSTKKLLRTDLLSSSENQWGEFHEWRKEIATEIGDHVFDEITDEIVREMLDSI